MHIMEGFLPWQWCLFWYLVSLPIQIWGVRKVIKLFREHPEQKIMVAVSGAFVFILSSLKLPSVTGSSSHPTGTGISTILYGVGVTAVLTVIVLVFQALLLAHGGITTLGANLFSMGIAGPFVAYLAFKGLQKVHASMAVSVFTAAFVADLFTYVVTAFQLSLAFPTNGNFLPSFEMFMAVYAISQVPLAIVEGIITVMFFEFLASSRPDLLAGKVNVLGKRMAKKARYTLAVSMVALIVVAMVLVRLIGLQGSDDAGSDKIMQIDPNYVPWFQSLLHLSLGEEILLFAVQGLIGVTIVFYAWRRFKRNKEEKGKEEESIVRD
jgi:cobalt/nickel transport system permease protein